MFFFKIFGKFVGILLIIIGAATLIGLFIGYDYRRYFRFIHVPGIDFYNVVNSTNIPIWLVSLLGLFCYRNPFFFLNVFRFENIGKQPKIDW